MGMGNPKVRTPIYGHSDFQVLTGITIGVVTRLLRSAHRRGHEAARRRVHQAHEDDDCAGYFRHRHVGIGADGRDEGCRANGLSSLRVLRGGQLDLALVIGLVVVNLYRAWRGINADPAND